MHQVNDKPKAVSSQDAEVLESIQSALDALGERLAILDAQGCVRWVNRPWRLYAAHPGAPPFAAVGVGANYLEACRNAPAELKVAHDTLYGIHSVLEGLVERFSLEYSLGERRGMMGWYLMTASTLEDGSGGVVIAHREITTQKLAEQERDRLNLDLQYAMSSVHTLSTLLPICGSCGQIRTDQSYLDRLQLFFSQHAEINSFGICPDCHERLCPPHPVNRPGEADRM
jgi:PAS domain-containing protein